MAADPITEAIRAGKFPPSRRSHYERLMAADPEGTKALLARMGSAVPVGELGAAGPKAERGPLSRAVQEAVEADRQKYPPEWVGKLRDPNNPPQVMKADD